jgi:hypothetical protein
MRAITLSPLVSIADVVRGWHIVRVSIGPRADVVILCSDKRLGYDVIETDEGTQVKQRSEGPVCLRIYHLVDGHLSSVTLPPVERGPVFIAQPFGTNAWLVVRSRIERGSMEGNAIVYSASGCAIGAFHVSDAIADVQVTDDKHTWVSYHDEGAMTGPELALAGLVCFSPNGAPIFRYSDVARDFDLEFIGDCEALNVATRNEAWLSYYATYPLVKLVDGKFYRAWRDIPVSMARAFAVGNNRVLFGGGKLKEPNDTIPIPAHPAILTAISEKLIHELQERWRRPTLYLVSLDTMDVEQFQAVDVAGNPIECPQFLGRANRLYLVTQHDLYSVDLSDV